jgi:hypothetical protein
MSDDFLHIARKEIQEDLEFLQKILDNCKSDNDIFNNAKKIENHLHKIKGLAPMMGEKDIGEIAKMTDTVTKYVMANGPLKDSLKNLVESNKIMHAIFCGQYKENCTEFKEKIRNTFANVLK